MKVLVHGPSGEAPALESTCSLATVAALTCMCGLCSLSLQSCHRPGGDGFRPEQTKNDPTRCLQGACQGDSTSLQEFLEMERGVQTWDCTQTSAAGTEQPVPRLLTRVTVLNPFLCFLCCDSCIYCIHVCFSW